MKKILLLSLIATFNSLFAMDNEKPLVPFEPSKETQVIIGNSDFKDLVIKTFQPDANFNIELGMFPGTEFPLVIIDDNKFVIFDKNIIANSLNIDFKGLNIIALFDMSIAHDINIECDNMLAFGSMISEQGNISLNTTNNFYGFGVNIKADKDASIIAQSDVKLDSIQTSAKNWLKANLVEALNTQNLMDVGFIMIKMLMAANPEVAPVLQLPPQTPQLEYINKN